MTHKNHSFFQKFPMSVSENSAEHKLQINRTYVSYPDNLSAIRGKHTASITLACGDNAVQFLSEVNHLQTPNKWLFICLHLSETTIIQQTVATISTIAGLSFIYSLSFSHKSPCKCRPWGLVGYLSLFTVPWNAIKLLMRNSENYS